MIAAEDLGQMQQLPLAPLDAAAEYIRAAIARVLPAYVLAMIPHAVITALLIDAVCGEQRDQAYLYCAVLTAAMLWRWAGLALLQRQIQRDMRINLEGRFWKRLPAILLLRLLANVALTWGIFALIIPSFYGLYAGSFAAPMLLEDNEPMWTKTREALGWIGHSGRRLGRIFLAMIVLTLWLFIAIEAIQYFFVQIALPSLAGLSTDDLEITTHGWAWTLGIFYIMFLLLDFFWTVASVFIYYQSQSRRLAMDLRAQFENLSEQPAA